MANVGIPFPDIDPVLFSVGGLDIRWYALSYVVGIFLGWWYLGRLDRREPKVMSQKAYDDFIIWAVLGIMVGGRLGYVLFYGLEFFLKNPSQILAVWNGGMSFHGGLLGAMVAAWLMCRRYKMRFLSFMDLCACVTPIGLFFGRIANFINGELYGRPTDVPWAVIFPDDPFARHPSQLYEAGLEGILLFFIMLIAFRSKLRDKTGALSGVFLIGYSISRMFVELYREPDEHIGFLFGSLTMGQLLSIPMILGGIWLILRKNVTKSVVASPLSPPKS